LAKTLMKVVTIMSIRTAQPVQHTATAVIIDLPPSARLARAVAMNRAADMLALAGLRRRHPSATSHALGVALALQRIGRTHDRALAARLTKDTTVTDSPADFLSVAVRAATVCTDLGIPYLIGGGVASTVHGEFRTTRDVDLVIRLTPADAAHFTAGLGAQFTLNPPDIVQALAHVRAALPIAPNVRPSLPMIARLATSSMSSASATRPSTERSSRMRCLFPFRKQTRC